MSLQQLLFAAVDKLADLGERLSPHEQGTPIQAAPDDATADQVGTSEESGSITVTVERPKAAGTSPSAQTSSNDTTTIKRGHR